jgi:hypothetical protein
MINIPLMAHHHKRETALSRACSNHHSRTKTLPLTLWSDLRKSYPKKTKMPNMEAPQKQAPMVPLEMTSNANADQTPGQHRVISQQPVSLTVP